MQFVWWNVNKRFYLYEKFNKNFSCVFDSNYDCVFILETNLDFAGSPEIKNYTLFSDPNVKKCSYGGVCCYIKDKIAKMLHTDK